jgi:hypothetical protein
MISSIKVVAPPLTLTIGYDEVPAEVLGRDFVEAPVGMGDLIASALIEDGVVFYGFGKAQDSYRTAVLSDAQVCGGAGNRSLDVSM